MGPQTEANEQRPPDTPQSKLHFSMSSRRSSSKSPATTKPARKQRTQVVRDEDAQVEAALRHTADPLPLSPGEWQGDSISPLDEPATAAAALSASAPVDLGPSAAQAARAEGGSDRSSEPPAKKAKKAGKKRLASLDSLPGFAELANAGNASTGQTTGRREKPIKAEIILARNMQGAEKGTYSGRVFYGVSCVYEENEKLGQVVEKVMHQKPRWFKDWGVWAVPCQLKPKALMHHEAIKKELPLTGRRVNGVLNVTLYDNPAVKKFEFTLAESELQFETRAEGILPRSIMVCATRPPSIYARLTLLAC